MTSTFALLWIICTVWISTDGESCPEGARVHLSSLRCYWLSEKTSSWTGARESCSETHGGNLASAEGFELQNFLFNLFPVKTIEWVWIQRQEAPEGDESQGRCSQMAFGTPGGWRKAQCSGQYLSLCEKKATDYLPSIDSYLTGLVLMTGIYTYTQTRPLPSVPDIGQQTVEVQLFPGLWFSHAGQLAAVELVVQPNEAPSSARIQILRPYCKPNHHLVPPGCSSLLNPFSCCSAVPLCNTTGGCSTGQYWCHLLEACMPMTSPCSPYDLAAEARGFVLPPRYIALSPLYHLAADLPLEVNPSSELRSMSVLLPEQAIMVYPDDIVAIQHTADSGKFLHCLNHEASRNSSWRQSYLSFRGAEWGGWLEGGLTLLPQGSQWVDGVVCDLKILYMDTLHKATEHEELFDYTRTETTTASGLDSSLRSMFRITVIHPLPDEKNQIHIRINTPTLIVVKTTFGQKVKSSWSAPVLQDGIPFLPTCPEEIDQTSPGCKFHDAWFSSVTFILPTLGVHILNISVMDGESSQNVTVKVVGHETVAGLSFEPRGCLRMLVDKSQSFSAKVERGSTVKFTWVIDDLYGFAHEGESYSVMFKKPAQYKLQVTASNPISSQSQQILLTADEAAPMAPPEFLSVTEVVALDVTYIYTIRVKVDVSLPVTLRWDFGDGSNDVVHTQSAPCQATEEMEETGDKQVYIYDSVNYTYSIPENYNLHVKVSNQYDNTEASMRINVRTQLNSLVISPSTPVPVVQQPLHLEASVKPSDLGVSYTWNFGDGSKSVEGIDCKINHSFGSAGVFNITVSANNTFTSLTAWLLLVVLEKISGLTVSYSRPSEAGFATKFRAEVASGTNLLWNFDFGDGSLQEKLTADSISHIYKFPGEYRVNVTVFNSVSQAHQSITVEVYILTVSGVLPTECVMTGHKIPFTALVNGNASVLTFQWLFGDGSPLNVVTGQPKVMHTFPSHGVFPVNLTVFSYFTSVSFTSNICVVSPISKIVVQTSKNIVAVGENVCLKVLVFPEQITGYQFKWLTNLFGLWSANTENSEKCFVFRDEGVEEIFVKASNKVSNETAQTSITIQKPVSKFSIRYDLQSGTLTVNMLTSFWVQGCVGSNVSMIWDFGDQSPVKQMQNVSHVFTTTGQFTVKATAFNQVSRNSAILKVNVLLPVSDLSLHTNQPYAVVGEETLFTAVSSDISTTDYYWTVVGEASTKRDTEHFRFVFPKPGLYQVKVMALNLMNQREAALSIEVYERIEGPQIGCFSLTKTKYVPTHDEIQCIASVTKGSNVTYHWFATQSEIAREITGNGDLFHVTAETPGIISVQLRASNVLGEVSSSVSLVAVESVTNAHIATQSNIVTFSEVVNFSVVVDTGSDLQYFWYVDSDPVLLQTKTPFLLHTFTNVGQHLVGLSVQNAISQSNDTSWFVVVEKIQKVDFNINSKKHPFYVNASAVISFHGFVHRGSDLHWEWKMTTAKENMFTSTNQTVIYTFSHAGLHQVYLNASNIINWQTVSYNVTVQDAVQGLQLNISKLSLCTGEQVTFVPRITKGTNVSFVLIVTNKDWVHREDISEGHYTTSILPVGKNVVTVKALNHVSSAETSAIVLVIEKIQGLRLVNCCSTTLEALKGRRFKAEVQSGFPVNYTYIFDMERSTYTHFVGEEVTFIPPESGLLSVRVLASNGVCSQELNETMLVERPVKKVKLVCGSEKIFVDHAVWFSAVATEGSNIRYLWDFGDSTEAFATQSNNISHTYYDTGKYHVIVKVLNNVSQVSGQLLIEAEALQCPNPHAFLIQNQSTIVRSRLSFFEATIDVNCSAYKTTYRWEIFRETYCSNDGTNLSTNKVHEEDAASPLLLLPKSTLKVGRYCLVFTVSLQGTPLLVQRKTAVTVVHSPLVAVIKGGSHRLWSSLSDLVLDGSDSQDPDMEPGVEDTLRYHWAFMMARSTEAHFVKQPTVSIDSRTTIPSTQLHAGSIYIFTLTVHKEGRSASINQTVTVTEAPVLNVSVECVSCSSAHRISYTNSVVLAGHCGQCDVRAQYKWRAEDQSGQTLELDKITTTTERYSPNLVVRSGVLKPGRYYSFVLDVSQPVTGQWGKASLKIQPNSPPHGGLCDLSPESDVRLLETLVTYNCSGWQDEESSAFQLIYTFQAVQCQSISRECPVLTLYRGTQSTFSSLVPMGIPGHQKNVSIITVILLVEDHLEAKVIALEKTLTVENPTQDKTTGKWFRNKSQTEFLALVQRGNPQEIIPYSMALISKLNQMEFGQTAEELTDRQEIRKNVTQALTSLPVSSEVDLDQISSALSQSTAVPSELVCARCHEKVLETVGKMIHVLEKHTSPSVLPVVNQGRNILSVIGSTLAAVSKSQISDRPNTKSLQADPGIALLGLGHVGELMRVLMRSRVRGEEPLSLSSNYITTVGFQGSPSELLCTEPDQHHVAHSQSPPGPCQFHIPAALTTHLQSNRPEVVQVVYGTEGALECDALLTEADPPISTNLVAMELTTPQGQPIPIQDLKLDQAIRVTLPNRKPVDQGPGGRSSRGSEVGNGTCLTVTIPAEGRLNFTVKTPEDLDESAGLYVSFNFRLAPGAIPVSLGHVKLEVTSAVRGTNASRDSLVREWALALPAPISSSDETIFLSPLLNGRNGPLSVNMTSSLVDGGPVQMSVCVFSSLCRFYSLKERRWSSKGLRPLEGSTLHTAHCLTQHLTMFGASLFVHPGAVVLLPPSAGQVRNVLVGIVCTALVLIHLLVGLIAHKLDHMDSLRLSQVPLCGRPGLFHYRVLVKTGWRPGAGTTAHVGISLYGVNKSGSRHLQRDGAFQRGSLDQFHVETDDNLGEVWKIRIWHDNTGLDPSWYVEHVVVWDTQTDHMFFFLVEDWLSLENHKTGSVEKEVLASCPEELSQFRRVLSSQVMFGLMERHLWLSLWERPAHSRFTRAQRVTCSALLLHLYLAFGALWYGAVGTEEHSEPVSAHLLINVETIAVGMTVAVLVFPLQCFICFLFRKAHSQITVDMSVPPSPICHSVEMDVYLGQSGLSGPSFLSLPDSSGPVRDSPSSLLESKALDSSILDFWTASGLAPLAAGMHEEESLVAWQSCDSLLNSPTGTRTTPDGYKVLPVHGTARQLRRKKATMQLHLAIPVSHISPATVLSSSSSSSSSSLSKDIPASVELDQRPYHVSPNRTTVGYNNLTTLLTLSEEDLLMSIAAAEDTADATNSNSDSGRDSPRTMSSFSTTRSDSCNSWSEQSEDKSPYGGETSRPDIQFTPNGPRLYKYPSVLSLDSVASTFLPSPSPDSTRSPSTTRIGVLRGQPGQLLPPWALSALYLLVAMLMGVCLAAVGLYGSFFSRKVVLMWLASALSAFLTSALLLEPLKVCAQALIHTALWRPVDPEVEEQLARETAVVRTFGEQSGKVRPPCGYGLLQAKEEARKVQALQALMRHCVCQLLFLLLVLLVNYQDRVEQRQGRLLHSAVRQRLHTAPPGFPNLTSLRDWSDTEQWISHTLLPHLYQNPRLRLIGSPRLQYTHLFGASAVELQGNESETRRLIADLRMADKTKRTQFEMILIDFTHHHRESGLFICVSVRLMPAQMQPIASSLAIHPLFIPSSSSEPDLQLILTIVLLISALLGLFGELRSMATERAQYLRQCHHWFQLLLALWTLAAAVLQLCSQSLSSSCISKFRAQPRSFINFHSAALLAEKSAQCAALLLTLLVLKLLGTLRFVRRWVVIGRVLQRTWRELRARAVLMLLLLLLCTHLGNTLFSGSVEGFLSLHQTSVSVLSMLRGRAVLQRLCKVHPVLGPLYGLLLLGGCVWFLARLCGAVLVCTYREEQAELLQPAIEPQDYEMVEFFIKRLKLWMGITKAKQFRHRVKFEGMDVPPSRASQESRLSNLSSRQPSSQSSSLSSSFSSPRPPSSALSVRSEDSSGSETGFEVQPYLDSLMPCVTALLSRFDRVNQVIEDIHSLEVKLEEVQSRRRKVWMSNKEESEEKLGELVKTKEHDQGEVRHRKIGFLHPRSRISLPSSFPFVSSSLQSTAASIRIFPRVRSSYSESESMPQPRNNALLSEFTKPTPAISGVNAGSPGFSRLPRRRAWHSGSSHSADATQRGVQFPGAALFRNGGENLLNARPRSEEGPRGRISDGVPVKRKAWISEEPETE